MIDVYFWPTPNGLKLKLFLEETGLPHRLIPVDIGKGEQHKAAYRKISPNGKIPALVDHEPADGGAPLTLFESGALLLYLADKSGQLIPSDVRGRAEVLQWLFWQVGGLGPMAGQNGHFRVYAPTEISYAIERYTNEVHRLFGVMNQRLADREFLAGAYSIADVACYPWVVPYKQQGQNLDDFPHLKRWFHTIAARPATVRTYQGVAGPYQRERSSITDEERKHLFGQRANA
ncbi:MAG: glutathione binding-like protein [Steroidobacteraceae bacterium]